MSSTPGLPDDGLPIVERCVVRLVVQDRTGLVFVFRTHDEDLPELGWWWELPGGGIEPGETYRDAAVRELEEDTGLVVDPSQVGLPLWRRVASFLHRGSRRLQHEVVAQVQIGVQDPPVTTVGQMVDELEDYVGWTWLSVEQIQTSTDRFYPGALPRLIGDLLAGREIDEPLELWS